MSLVVLDESVHIGESFWSNTAVKFVLGYYSLTVALTILSTGLLLARLLLVRSQTIKILGTYQQLSTLVRLCGSSVISGHSESSAQYLTVAAILVESSAVYTIWAIIFIGLYAVNSPYQDIFLSTISAVQVRFSQLTTITSTIYIDPYPGHCPPHDHVSCHSWDSMASNHCGRNDESEPNGIQQPRRENISCESQ